MSVTPDHRLVLKLVLERTAILGQLLFLFFLLGFKLYRAFEQCKSHILFVPCNPFMYLVFHASHARIKTITNSSAFLI